MTDIQNIELDASQNTGEAKAKAEPNKHKENYTELSINLTKKLDKKVKKKEGIFFTPKTIIDKTLKCLKPYMKSIKQVLEPSCGSGEFIKALAKNDNVNQKGLTITGIEFNKDIFNSIKHLESESKKLFNEDFLKYTTSTKFDLVIGNPPFYVIKKEDLDSSLKSKYKQYYDGRPNIFIMFIIKSLELLSEDGILAFVLPNSFLNCIYYDKTRKHIKEKYKIIDILECADDYIDTKQKTIILIVKNGESNINNDDYVISKNNYTILGPPSNIESLKSFYNNSQTLKELGFKVNVGNVVWNQIKTQLTNDLTSKNSEKDNKKVKNTLLIYSSYINSSTKSDNKSSTKSDNKSSTKSDNKSSTKNKQLDIKKHSNVDKKNYIDNSFKKKGDTGPLLVINRGYGVGTYSFDYCLVNRDDPYLIENHLICVKYTKQIDKSVLIKLYEKIMESFDNEKTKKFIELYFSNNAINTTELCEILPIYGDFGDFGNVNRKELETQ
jgi:type I restriction-modification system DNA methylase subunit